MKILDVPQSGSINFRTASRNRNGQYLRARAIPVQPRSTAQLAVRGYLSLNSQEWGLLTKVQQAAWATYADLHPRTDALGQSSAMTGAQAYGSVNNILRLQGLSVLPAPPAQPDFTLFAAAVVTSVALSVTLTGFTRPVGGQIAIYATRPAGNGRNFYGAPTFILFTTGASTSPLNIATQIAARFGTLSLGQVMQIRQVPVTSGILGAPQVSTVTIAT
jgi:hypothetical protein